MDTSLKQTLVVGPCCLNYSVIFLQLNSFKTETSPRQTLGSWFLLFEFFDHFLTTKTDTYLRWTLGVGPKGVRLGES